MPLFGDPATWPGNDFVCVSAEIDAALILAGYREGVFPLPLPLDVDLVGWWSPVRRAVFPLDGLRISRSLRQSARRYHCTTDRAFADVIRRCADPHRANGWLSEDFVDLYCELHEAGYAHSVETWDAAGRLVGGLYGVRVGRLVSGESMFHDPDHGRDASKVALWHLVETMTAAGDSVLDTQWLTGHLASLGAVEIPRLEYLRQARHATRLPGRPWPLLRPDRK